MPKKVEGTSITGGPGGQPGLASLSRGQNDLLKKIEALTDLLERVTKEWEDSKAEAAALRKLCEECSVRIDGVING